MVRVRFAPSPTGFLHIGGGRTALFNWIYAKATGGQFILRIEDTDVLRSKKEYLDEILYSLDWLGFKWDEIYYQSQRFDIYKKYAQELLDSGKAYLADKLPEDQVDPNAPKPAGGQAIILKIEPRKVVLKDIIRGDIEFDSSVIKDQVLIKSDGSPTYNFACVIDDALMNITHVIRGDDHISNTPKQIIIYEALGFKLPEFAHLPLILSKEGGRLSKRKGATAISEYRDMGYTSESLVNFLLLLGWSPGGDQEIIAIEDAIKKFTIKHINKTAAVLDMEKLSWINNQYLKNADPQKLMEELIPSLIEKGFINKENIDRNYLLSLVKLFQARLTTLSDFVERADAFFLQDPVMEEEALKKLTAKDLSKEFDLFAQRLKVLEPFDIVTIETCFRDVVKELNLQTKDLIHPVRAALTGKTVGPGFFEVIYYLGKERSIYRLNKWIKKGENV